MGNGLGRLRQALDGRRRSLVDPQPPPIRDRGFMIEGKLLADIIRACADRMSRKIAGGAGQVSS